MNLFRSLMTTFATGAITLFILVALLAASLLYNSNLQLRYSEWQSSIGKLQRDIDALHQQAQHYKLNAPRDFDSYNRDLAVFYQQFQQQLSRIAADLSNSNQAAAQLHSDSAIEVLLAQQGQLQTAKHTQQTLSQQWQTFNSALMQTLGDPQEPRLEWGAEYIIAQQPQLATLTDTLYSNISSAKFNSQHTATLVLWSLLALVVIYLLATMALMMTKVLRPVIHTTRACEQVAGGEYGLTIALSGAGETRRLQQAFNELSARSQLIMDMLGYINQLDNTEDKLQAIYRSGQSALGCGWIGLMECQRDSIALKTSAPNTLHKQFRHKAMPTQKSLGQEFNKGIQQGWLELENMRDLSLTRFDERFLRELQRITVATHMVGYPFKAPNGHDYYLLFTTSQAQGFNAQQRQLIKVLGRLMAEAIFNNSTATTANGITLRALHI